MDKIELNKKIEDLNNRIGEIRKLIGTPSQSTDKETYSDYLDAITERDALMERKRFFDKLADRRWSESNVGPRFRECTFSNFDGGEFSEQKSLCQHFVQDLAGGKSHKTGLLLYGSVGTGKTHLATATARELISIYGMSVYFDTFFGLLRSIRSTYEGARNDAEKTAKDCDVLVLDDLGKERMTEWASEMLFDIVDARYRSGKVVIVTSNYTPAELSERVDQAVMSRLAEMCVFVRMFGHDYRMKGAV